MKGEIFSRYKKAEERRQILLLYLILNDYNVDMVDRVVEVVKQKEFGTEFKRIYGETDEVVDVEGIEQEINQITVPIICSLQSYELNSNAETIHIYRPKLRDKSIYINDLGIISQFMVIDKEQVVSSNLAASVESTDEKGFMYFYDYVLKGHTVVGEWEIEYKDKKFTICHITAQDGKERKDCLYSAIELDQTATFRLVLYIIRKEAKKMEEFLPDNYEEEMWKLAAAKGK